ncbi:hypothetical protein NUW58_g854 [Xylaria curta]|uniref:Uncharacterized protein n=1 Tax=Xylaria curta TaxID=42375 RepID=A0ACC1PNN0_9PEZI|nr:hypothetical protein NUW58_g854 [Xylaria curta]
MQEVPRHAIVYGASGIIGWAVVDHLLRSYPKARTFPKITALTNREVKRSESHWPGPDISRPNLQLVSGIDLRGGDGAALASALEQAVEDIHTVTHLYYLGMFQRKKLYVPQINKDRAFTSVPDEVEEVATNRRMLQNVIDAHNLLSPSLQFVVFPGGTRGYGIYSPGGIFTPPLTEDMVNKLPSDYAKTVVYPANRELLRTASEGKGWTWCEVCPDAIIGFTPNGSQFSLAFHWAQYLSLYAYNHGVGPSVQQVGMAAVKVPFPGNAAGANSLFSPASAAKIARFIIYASLHADKCGEGQLFNIADHEVPCTYGELWPRLANWFGLVGVGPPEGSQGWFNKLRVGGLPKGAELMPGEYVVKHKYIFSRCGRIKAMNRGVSAGSGQLDSIGHWLTFNRQLSLEKLKKTGFEGNTDPYQGWIDSFQMFRIAGLIL